MSKVIVIGAGPAGMMAAMTAAKKHEVILLDGNEKVGKKLFITGKGRCNVTNSKDISEFFDYIPGNPHFLYSALYTFTNEDTMKFFSDVKIKLKSERGGRVFPASDKSSDIIKGLTIGLDNAGVKVLLKHKVIDVIMENNRITKVITENRKTIKGDHFIIATGGASYPLTGSTGDGQRFAEKLGHNVIELKPSLVPIEISDEWIKDLSKLSLRNIGVSIKEGKKTVYKNQGELLFTNFGVSGPTILRGSRYVKKGEYTLCIDLKPALDEKTLDTRVIKDFSKYINNEFKDSLDDLLPKQIIPIVIRLSGIDENKKVNEITKEERRKLVSLIKNFTLHIKGLRSLKEAIVTEGGVDTLEIDPSTMRSKIISNLSFAGEVMDVDAFTGGYNVQVALSTGFIAGENI